MAKQPIDDLRATVRKLKPTGTDGFEGLMAVVLTDLTKRTFALASSGSQRGKDGQSTLDDGAISFEGKLYEDAVAKDQILSKIAELAVDEEGQTAPFGSWRQLGPSRPNTSIRQNESDESSA
jgi:hypothetical protein